MFNRISFEIVLKINFRSPFQSNFKNSDLVNLIALQCSFSKSSVNLSGSTPKLILHLLKSLLNIFHGNFCCWLLSLAFSLYELCES